MAFVQSTYSENIAVALPGMAADADISADTRIVETAAGIGFGVAVSQGTSDKECLIGGASAAVFVGVTLRSITGDADSYDQYDNASVITRGDVWVTVAGDVTAGGDVTFKDTTGALSSAAAGANDFAIAGARWMTSASSGDLAKLRLSGSLPSA